MRYLATVAPLGKTDPAVWSSAFNDGSFETEERGGWKELRELNQGREREYASARGWARSRADGAAHGVELGSDQQYLGNRRDAKGEREWAERLALSISDTASLEHDPQSVYEAVPEIARFGKSRARSRCRARMSWLRSGTETSGLSGPRTGAAVAGVRRPENKIQEVNMAATIAGLHSIVRNLMPTSDSSSGMLSECVDALHRPRPPMFWSGCSNWYDPFQSRRDSTSHPHSLLSPYEPAPRGGFISI